MASLKNKLKNLVSKKAPVENQKGVVYLPALAAALACAGTDSREYLRGVFLTFEDDVTRVVGTDGHRMCVVDPSKPLVESVNTLFKVKREKHNDVIIAHADVKELLSWRVKSSIVAAEFATIELLADGQVMFRTWDGKKTLTCKPVDATYPEYKRCIPKERTQSANEQVAFNGQYLADLMKVAKAGFMNKIATIVVELNKPNEPAIFRMEAPDGSKLFVVLMPMRM